MRHQLCFTARLYVVLTSLVCLSSFWSHFLESRLCSRSVLQFLSERPPMGAVTQLPSNFSASVWLIQIMQMEL